MRHPLFALCAVAVTALIPCMSLWADERPDIEIRFVPQAEFSKYVSEYVPGNIGFFRVTWNSSGEITRAIVLVASDVTTQPERTHTVREELTQALGLMQDSYRYRESIFYQGWTTFPRYSNMDKAVIRMLYRPEVRTNMNCQEARTVLARGFTDEQLQYFSEIAFGCEYSQADTLAHKWKRSPRIAVYGELTRADIRNIHQCVQEINALTGDVQLKLAAWSINQPATVVRNDAPASQPSEDGAEVSSS